MKTNVLCCFVLWIGPTLPAYGAPVGTRFTYQGRLKQGDASYTGLVDLQFSLWDDPTDDLTVGTAINLRGVDVVNGLFTVDLDFGAAPFGGDARYLQIAVRAPAGVGNFVTLSPRQSLNPAPYGVTALSTVGIDGHSLDAAAGSPTDALFVNNSGFVGIGTTAPGAPLEAVGSSQTMLSLSSSHAAGGGGADGTCSVPYQNVQTAYDIAANGSVILFRAGSYPQPGRVLLTKTMKLFNQPTAGQSTTVITAP
jgi:hypothetical protein